MTGDVEEVTEVGDVTLLEKQEEGEVGSWNPVVKGLVEKMTGSWLEVISPGISWGGLVVSLRVWCTLRS